MLQQSPGYLLHELDISFSTFLCSLQHYLKQSSHRINLSPSTDEQRKCAISKVGGKWKRHILMQNIFEIHAYEASFKTKFMEKCKFEKK